jgi:hypothetical protein
VSTGEQGPGLWAVSVPTAVVPALDSLVSCCTPVSHPAAFWGPYPLVLPLPYLQAGKLVVTAPASPQGLVASQERPAGPTSPSEGTGESLGQRFTFWPCDLAQFLGLCT